MEFGDIVYHVANPAVKGVVVDPFPSGDHINVIFQTPVSFSGNKPTGFDRRWCCSKELLFDSPQKAVRNHNPKLA